MSSSSVAVKLSSALGGVAGGGVMITAGLAMGGFLATSMGVVTRGGSYCDCIC